MRLAWLCGHFAAVTKLVIPTSMTHTFLRFSLVSSVKLALLKWVCWVGRMFREVSWIGRVVRLVTVKFLCRQHDLLNIIMGYSNLSKESLYVTWNREKTKEIYSSLYWTIEVKTTKWCRNLLQGTKNFLARSLPYRRLSKKHPIASDSAVCNAYYASQFIHRRTKVHNL